MTAGGWEMMENGRSIVINYSIINRERDECHRDQNTEGGRSNTTNLVRSELWKVEGRTSRREDVMQGRHATPHAR